MERGLKIVKETLLFLNSGGVVERWWILQLTAIIHRQGCRRRIHHTSCPSHYCFCQHCPGTHVPARGTNFLSVTLATPLFVFIRAVKRSKPSIPMITGLWSWAFWGGIKAKLGDGAAVGLHSKVWYLSLTWSDRYILLDMMENYWP